jgi:dTDP-4-amino-4,6-dideoxygalactose transaminase
MESQHFILGPKVEQCEAAVAAYSECTHGVGVSSGSDALLLCLMAENIGPGDEVITTPYTFFATVGAIARLGATPVFVDIDPATYNLNVDQIHSRITPRTRAIIPVHLYGQMADVATIMAIADAHALVVIEDAAQAIGAEYKGRRAGSIGHYGCLSFFPSKNLGAGGDAGMVLTNDSARADRLTLLRGHGARPKYFHQVVGGNFRLDALQAAIVSAKLPHLDRWTEARQANAARYDQLFKDAGLSGQPDSAITLPRVDATRHIFNQYVIRIAARDALQSYLKAHGVGTEVYYPVPMHLQDCFAYLNLPEGSFAQSEKAARETLAIPVHPELREDQARFVVDCIAEFIRKQAPASVSRRARESVAIAGGIDQS